MEFWGLKQTPLSNTITQSTRTLYLAGFQSETTVSYPPVRFFLDKFNFDFQCTTV